MKAAGKFPFRSIPTLSIDKSNMLYAESGALLRYAGKRTGLYSSCENAALKVDMVVDALESILAGAFAATETLSGIKFSDVTFPRYFGTSMQFSAK